MAFDFLQRRISQQLGAPSGLLGGLVVSRLNTRNRAATVAAVAALGLDGGESVADIGYGGGVGLQLLLDATGVAGVVHGVEPSPSMIKRAGKEFSAQVSDGRLRLHEATMDALPLGDGELEAWISLNTVYFIEDLGPSFGELRRVLSASGRGVLGVADPQWLADQSFAKTGFLIRPLEEILDGLDAAGLHVTVRTLSDGDPDAEGVYHLLVCVPS